MLTRTDSSTTEDPPFASVSCWGLCCSPSSPPWSSKAALLPFIVVSESQQTVPTGGFWVHSIVPPLLLKIKTRLQWVGYQDEFSDHCFWELITRCKNGYTWVSLQGWMCLLELGSGQVWYRSQEATGLENGPTDSLSMSTKLRLGSPQLTKPGSSYFFLKRQSINCAVIDRSYAQVL